MRHLVISRFNAGNPDPDYFDYRLPLFEKICLPSLLDQTIDLERLHFYFVCDIQTSTSRMAKLRNTLKPLPHATPIFGSISGRMGVPTRKPAITTRIDNDDAIAPFFLSGIEQVLEIEAGGYSCYSKGAYWDMEGHRWREVIPDKPNQFLSRYSVGNRQGDCESVYDVKHGDAHPCKYIDSDGPAWVWTLHSQKENQQMSNKCGNGILPHLHPAEGWRPEEELFEMIPSMRGVRS